MPDLEPIFAITAGVLTFFSSCLIPIVPSYLAYITGINLSDLANQEDNFTKKYRQIHWQVFFSSLYFVLGFSVIFILLGITASTLGQFLVAKRYILEKVGGVFVVLLGLYLVGQSKIPWFYRSAKFRVKKISQFNSLNSFLVGTAFGFAWVPCFSPILASILILASISATMWQGTYLLILFSLGVAIPFLLIGLLLSYSLKILPKISRYLKTIQLITGLLIITTGILILIGK